MTGFKGKFKPIWWKWYLVDVRNWHKPVIVKKHFDNAPQCEDYKDRWLGNEFEAIIGKRVIDLKLKWGINRKRNHRHRTQSASKYRFPKHVKTQEEKQLFRLRQQRKTKRMKRLPELTYKDLNYILNKRPIGFLIRTKAFRSFEFAYSEGRPSLKHYIKKYKWPSIVNLCTVIEKTLEEYNYDTGPWPIHLVVIKVYELYGEKVDKFHYFNKHQPSFPRRAKEEFIARGFARKVPGASYVGSMEHLNWHLNWPEAGRFGGPEGPDDKSIHIYELQSLTGISRFTTAFIPRQYRS